MLLILGVSAILGAIFLFQYEMFSTKSKPEVDLLHTIHSGVGVSHTIHPEVVSHTIHPILSYLYENEHYNHAVKLVDFSAVPNSTYTSDSFSGPDPEWINYTPDIKMLYLIDHIDEQKKYYFIQEIQNDCKRLGTQLNIEIATIRGFETRSDSVPDLCERVLSEWIKRGKNATWGELLKAMKDIKHGRAYVKLKEALSSYYK